MAALTSWLAQALHPPESRPGADDSLWAIRKKDISRAIRCSGNSLPGPDRIPYVAWRKLGPLATDVLFDAARAMARSDWLLFFHYWLLFFLTIYFSITSTSPGLFSSRLRLLPGTRARPSSYLGLIIMSVVIIIIISSSSSSSIVIIIIIIIIVIMIVITIVIIIRSWNCRT